MEHNNRRTRYLPVAVYSYEVAGRRYQHDQLWLYSADYTYDQRAAERVASQFRAGAPVQVFYDPDNPARAYLLAGDPPWALLVGGVIFLLIGGFLLALLRWVKM